MYVLIWSLVFVLPPYEYEKKDKYTFPADWWRVLLHVLGFLFNLVMIINEIWDFILSKRKHDRWRLWREKELQKVRFDKNQLVETVN